jgi:small conductance mechanosensitive channel
MLPIFAQVTNATDTVARGQQIAQAGYRWLTENGPKWAVALITALAVYVIGSWVASMIRSLLNRVLGKRGMEPTFSSYLANILHALLMVMVVITALSQLGVPTAQFAALIAAAGLAIGLALQGNLSNFASGFLLIFFRPFKRGDLVSGGGAEGIVDEVGIFTTTLNTGDNRRVIIPNSSIAGGNIINFTSNATRSFAVPCVVAGSNPIDKVRATLLAAAAENQILLKEPAPVGVVTQLGEGKYTMELRVWCPAPRYWDAVFSLNEQVKTALDKNGIAAPIAAVKMLPA